MKPKDFKKLCKKENVKLEDLPFHLPASDDDLKELIKKIGRVKKEKQFKIKSDRQYNRFYKRIRRRLKLAQRLYNLGFKKLGYWLSKSK